MACDFYPPDYVTTTITLVDGDYFIKFENTNDTDIEVIITEGTLADDPVLGIENNSFILAGTSTITVPFTEELCYVLNCAAPFLCWKRELTEEINFEGNNVVRDDADGFGYEWTLDSGEVCAAEFLYGTPNSQPCRSAACGHTSNTYEDTYPNVNAYGIQDDDPCQTVSFSLVFQKPICGDVRISFFDIDENAPADLNLDCGEIISNVNPPASGVDGDLVEISSGAYTGAGTGNTDSNGDLLFTGLPSTSVITFDVQIAGRLSFGLGLSGTQVLKFEETGTYRDGVFYNSLGEVIPEPDGWVDCT